MPSSHFSSDLSHIAQHLSGEVLTPYQTDKDKWIGVERTRWAKLFNIPMHPELPEGFPPLTLPIMRAMCALTVLHPGKDGQEILCKALDALFKAFWVEHKKTNEKEVLAEVLNSVLGKEEAEKGMFI